MIRRKPCGKNDMKAFSYLRVSGKAQVAGDGFTRQREVVRQYVRARRITVVEEFEEKGVSGSTEMAGRDGLARLFDKIESDGVRMVLVERADRLARDLLVSEVILAQFRELGVKVIEAASGNDLTAGDDDPTKVLIRQILGAVAQFDKNVVVRKLRVARERKRLKDGRCEGRKPYGSLPGEKAILDRITTLRRKPRHGKRMSYQKIANALNADGLLTRSDKPWRAGTIRNIVARSRPALA